MASPNEKRVLPPIANTDTDNFCSAPKPPKLTKVLFTSDAHNVSHSHDSFFSGVCERCGTEFSPDVSVCTDHTDVVCCDKCGWIEDLHIKENIGQSFSGERPIDSPDVTVIENIENFEQSVSEAETHCFENVKQSLSGEEPMESPDTIIENIEQGDQYLHQLLSSVIAKSPTELKVVKEILTAIHHGNLKSSHLLFHLIYEACQQLNAPCLRGNRYSDITKTFWKLFQLKFGSAPLRYLSGWKCYGHVLKGEAVDGHFETNGEETVLAIPKADVLQNYQPDGCEWPEKIAPGLCHAVVKQVAACAKGASLCLSLDGKKVAPGLKGDFGDVDLLGHEPDGSLASKQQRHASELLHLQTAIDLLPRCGSPFSQMMFTSTVQDIITNVCIRRLELAAMLEKKKFTLGKLQSEAGPDYRSSRYSYVISMLTANIVEINEALRTNVEVVDLLSSTVSSMNGFQHLHSPAEENHLCNLQQLIDIDKLSSEEAKKSIEKMGLPYIKQRSSYWFFAREKATLTGSRLYEALGGDTLKRQREIFAQVFEGHTEAEKSPEVKEAMAHGVKHEMCAVTTVCRNFLPVYHPNWKFVEVGGFPLDLEGVPVVVSPDGCLTEDGKPQAAVEIKCPYFRKQLHEFIPARYYLQVMAEMVALGTEQCLFVSFEDSFTRLFLVRFDLPVWSMAVHEIQSIYSTPGSRPASRTENGKQLFRTIKTNIKSNCSLLAEVRSVHVCDKANTVLTEMTTAFPFVEVHCRARENFVSTPEFVASKQSALEVGDTHLRKAYELLCQKATEMVALVISDLDRMNKQDRILGVPINYFLKGYSLPMDIMRNIMEDTLDKLHQEGLHVPIVSFDGAFMKLLNRDENNHPMTLVQLQKDFWHEVKSLSKASIIRDFKEQTGPDQYSVTREGARFTVALLEGIKLPKTAFGCGPETEEEAATDPMDMLISRLATDNVGSDQHQREDDTPGCEDNKMMLAAMALQSHAKHQSTLDSTILQFFSHVSLLQKLTIPELQTVCKALNIVISKPKKQVIVEAIAQVLNIPGSFLATRKKNPPSLLSLATKQLTGKKYAKSYLNVSYAEWRFPQKVSQWNKNLPFNHDMVIPGLEKYFPLQWSYSPQYSASRDQLELRRIDSTHLLTRTRSAMNRSACLGYAERAHLMEVAADMTTQLKVGMLEDNLNMQSTDLALLTFGEDVQEELEKKGYFSSAFMCQRIMDWFRACDDPAIPALTRCEMKLRYRQILEEFGSVFKFPPMGSHVEGYPKVLWEATLAAVDSDILLYALSRRGTYNQRSVSSQPCEGLFSSLATLPSAHNGAPSCVSLQTDMGKVIGESIIRLDSERNFPVRLSAAPVYSEKKLAEDVGELPCPKEVPVYIQSVEVKDHPFDSKNRRRRAPRKICGISDLHEPGRGVSGVRSYHKINEGQLNPLIRLGLSSNATLQNITN
ncbi:uncharacterized protein LOC106165781 [Lingula anatina]|uniref:Uncharacterized protein LOC106165781 n=1 Tax=Lingula anatina TaxID=7574 RepID=A0A1S3IMY3_LINAN|nr:uncharacterized protein LOC106165781 [Lingula anatina]|eukprot:XP_013399595.1 uncharacterized protein LOC106165781 [Lingula anatina]